MALNFTQLATFVRLAEEQNFTRAAEQLQISQPAVTQQVRALERDLGVTLVDVVGRRTEITAVGRLVAERGARLLREADALRRDVRDLAEAREGVLHLGATVTIGGYVLPAILARYRERFPGIRVEVTVDNTGAMIPMVQDGRVGIALVEGEVDADDLHCTPFADDEMILIAPPGHPLATGTPVSPALLSDEAFVSREAGSGTRATFVAALRAAGVDPRIVLALPTSEGIVRAVERGLGIAVISRLVAADALAADRVRAIAIDGVDIRRRFLVVARASRTPAPAAERLAALVLEA